MKPLIDGDIFLHEIGWSCQFKDEKTGEEILFDFERAEQFLLQKLQIINVETEADEPATIFVTDNPKLNARMSKEARWTGVEVPPYTPGFRYEVAKSKPYKGTRKNPKPFHFDNLLTYMRTNFDTVVAYNGLEADDLLCQAQYGRDDTVICSRDKDLRICPGWHYSWECGKQPAIGPVYTDEVGWLSFPEDREDVLGYGKAFFYWQMLVGDPADNIPGLPKVGKVGAQKALAECKTEEDYFKTVKQMYIEKLGVCLAKDYYMEQANLLWMQMDGEYKFPKT